MIHRPILSPKAGYVEVLDNQGNHVYKPTLETEIQLKREADKAIIQQDMDAMTVDYEYRLTLLELEV